MDCGEERSGVLCVPRGNTAPALNVQECILNQVPKLVDIFVIFSLDFTIAFGRNDRLCAALLRAFNNFIRVIGFVCKQVLCVYALDKAPSLCTIRSGTFRNKDSDRHTMRIHGKM